MSLQQFTLFPSQKFSLSGGIKKGLRRDSEIDKFRICMPFFPRRRPTLPKQGNYIDLD
jgi:hypothetical protein